MSAKTILLALDASEPRLLHQWMDAGDLPFLASLSADGSGAPVLNLKGFGDGVFWPCFSTGLNPARHGRMFVYGLDPTTYRMTTFDDDRDMPAEQFWERLDQSGLRVGVVDVVHAALRPLRNGVIICDWLTHSRGGPARSLPTRYIESLLAEFGDDPFDGSTDRFIRETPDYDDLTERLTSRIATKAQALGRMIAAEDWDLFIAGFGEPHDVGHMCWHLHESGNGDRSAAPDDPIKLVYQRLDQAMRELVEAAGPDANVIVVAGPGMEKLTTFNHSLDRLLARLEESTEDQSPPRRSRPAIDGRRRAVTGLDRWRKALPAGLRSMKPMQLLLRPLYRRIQHTLSGGVERIGQVQRRYFVQPHNDNAGAIRINLIGREAMGMVEPGEEFEQTLEFLANEFRNITDIHGEPLVADIVYPTSEYSGEHVERLSDMLLIWNRKVDIANLVSPTVGAIRGDFQPGRTGDHTPDGYLWIRGPGLRLQQSVTPMSPIDVTPTVFDILGVPSTGYEGRSHLEPGKRIRQPAHATAR